MNDKTVVENIDCMIRMREFPDKYFDLAIVDPPYGIGMDNSNKRTKPSRPNSYTNYLEFRYKESEWDESGPDSEYFNELFRVSKDQIIWGANYLNNFLPSGFGWIFWNKKNGVDNNFSDGEFAFSSKGIQSRYFECSVFDALNGGKDRIHPTQKPIRLYKWLLKNYAKEGDKILDTHGGSMSSVIACLDMGFPITCYEMDTDYYNQAKNRITNHLNQLNAFRPAYDIEFHDNIGISTLRNQHGVGYQKQKDIEGAEPIHRINGLFNDNTPQQHDEESKAASGA